MTLERKTLAHELGTIIRDVSVHLEHVSRHQVKNLSGLSETRYVELSRDAKKLMLFKEAQSLSSCTQCSLSEQRIKLVYDDGNPCSELMFIGEGPGEMENNEGKPFVGPAGQLLDKIITAMNLHRNNVYIANIVKCRPPEDRDPQEEEIAACFPFLEKQISIVDPKVIVTLGAVATHSLLNITEMISRLRGKFTSYKRIPVMPTYHPSYLLRNPSSKKDTWHDIQKVMKFLKTGVLENVQ